MAEAAGSQIFNKIAVLTQIYGDNVNKKYELCGSEVKIGRHLSSQIKVDNPSVSRTHCILFHNSEGWFIRDNGSQNGTYVNGMQILKSSSCHLRFGDIIFLGPPQALPTAFAFDDTHDPIRFKPSTLPSKVTVISKRNNEDVPQTNHSQSGRKTTEINQILTSDASKSSGVLDASVVEISSTNAATNSLHAIENPKRTAETSKHCAKVKFEVSMTPRRISPILNVAKKTKIDFNQDSQKGMCLNEIEDEDSQSLLEIGSCDLSDYPFSQQLDSVSITSDKKSNSLTHIVGNKSIKQEISLKTEEDDNGHLKSTLANLSEEIKRLEKSKSDLLKEYENMCQKNKMLDQQLAEQQKLKEDLKTCEMRVKNNVKSEIMEKLEEDLVCHICTELLIKPVVLDCSHTFCEHCIAEWKKKKKQCPICRNSIQSQTRVLALDHFIDRTLETFTPEQKEKRKELVSERERIKFEISQRRNQKRTPRGRRGRRRGRFGSSALLPMPVTTLNDIHVLSIIRPGTSAANDDPSDSIFISDDELDDMYGIGPCFNCGRYGHYHYDCPL